MSRDKGVAKSASSTRDLGITEISEISWKHLKNRSIAVHGGSEVFVFKPFNIIQPFLIRMNSINIPNYLMVEPAEWKPWSILVLHLLPSVRAFPSSNWVLDPSDTDSLCWSVANSVELKPWRLRENPCCCWSHGSQLRPSPEPVCFGVHLSFSGSKIIVDKTGWWEKPRLHRSVLSHLQPSTVGRSVFLEEELRSLIATLSTIPCMYLRMYRCIWWFDDSNDSYDIYV